jgi:hypothetical protein
MRKSNIVFLTFIIALLFRFSASRILQSQGSYMRTKPRCNLASTNSPCGESNKEYYCSEKYQYCSLFGLCEKTIPSGFAYDVDYSYARFQSKCNLEVTDLGGAVLALAVCFGWVLPLVYFSCFACFARDERIGDRFKHIRICIVFILWLIPVILMIIHICKRHSATPSSHPNRARRPTPQEIAGQHNAMNLSRVEYNQTPSDDMRRNSAPFIVGRAFRGPSQNPRISGKIHPMSPREFLQPV